MFSWSLVCVLVTGVEGVPAGSSTGQDPARHGVLSHGEVSVHLLYHCVFGCVKVDICCRRINVDVWYKEMSNVCDL